MAEADVISQFKGLGKAQPSVLHLLDDTSMRLLVVWHSGLCDRKLKLKPTDSPPGVLAAHHLWAWLWNRYEVYLEKWVELAGFIGTPGNLKRAQNLIDTRLVYPDGTIHEWIKNTLNAKAVAKYQSLTRSAALPAPVPAPAVPVAQAPVAPVKKGNA